MARHVFHCPLRWSDMDSYGHVNNVEYLRYLEEARIDLLLNAAGDAGQAMLDGGVLIARNEIDYRRPLVHRIEPVPIEIWVEEINAGSFSLGYVIADGPDRADVYAEARSVLVPFDRAAGRSRRVDAADRAWLERFLDD